jgi:hypothetical protein
VSLVLNSQCLKGPGPLVSYSSIPGPRSVRPIYAECEVIWIPLKNSCYGRLLHCKTSAALAEIQGLVGWRDQRCPTHCQQDVHPSHKSKI